MARVCPRCGRETSIVIDGLCPQCYAETRGIVRLPSRVNARICRYCGSVWLGGKWIPAGSFEDAVRLVAERAVSQARRDPGFERVSISGLRYETLPNWRTLVELDIEGFAGDIRAVQRVSLEIRLEPSICPVCKTRVSGEYDTVLQIRGLRPAGLDPGMVEELVIGESLRLGLARQLVDVIRHKSGVDVYFTNTGAARKLAKRLASLYGGSTSPVRYENVTITSTGRRRTRKTLVLRLG